MAIWVLPGGEGSLSSGGFVGNANTSFLGGTWAENAYNCITKSRKAIPEAEVERRNPQGGTCFQLGCGFVD